MERGENNSVLDSLVLSITSTCNLDCIYCQTKPFMNTLSDKILPLELYDKIMIDLKDFIQYNRNDSLEIYYTGGEPLLAGLNYYKNILDIQKERLPHGFKVTNIIQTNGTLLNPNWISFIKNNEFKLSISLDGPERIHNNQRFIKDSTSFKKIIDNIGLLRDNEVEFGLISVITEKSAEKAADIIPFLISLDPRLIALLPCVDRGPVISPMSYGDFLVKAFNQWIDPEVNPNSVPIRIFKELCLRVLSINTSVVCDYYGQCPRNPTINPDGSVYICDQFVGKKEGLLGNLNNQNLKDVIISEKVSGIMDMENNLSLECKKCEYLNLCNGGCFYRRLGNNIDYYCESRKKLFKCISEYIESIFSPDLIKKVL